MKLLIVSHVAHSLFNSKVYGYGPYIKEMNLWLKHVEAVKIVAPIIEQKPNAIDLAYKHNDLHMLSVPSFNITSKLQKLLTLMKMPYIFFVLLKGMLWADHIHLRCPGNMGLLGSIAQIFFPWKVKTAKYAGNWDPKSKQPRSYRIQQWILSNVFLSKRMKVLVYGEWKNQSTNIIPFFTASYKKNEICQVENRTLDEEIRLLFVGGLNEGKRPLISIQVAQKLIEDGYNVCLDMFGEGNLSEELSAYVKEHNLEKNVILHGNKSADIVKAYFQKAHFLIFISKSEGWPKVVAGKSVV